jgi:hypothetical protein
MAADVKVFIRGDAKDALAAVEKVSSAVDKFSSGLLRAGLGFGGFAALGLAAANKVAELFQKALDFVPNAIAETGKLAEVFRGLQVTAGMTTADFNRYTAAIQLAGGKSEDLAELVQGMERGIKKNSQNLIDNGIAANQDALNHLTLADYIGRVVKVMDSFGSATEKDQLLMAAFGRGGLAFAAQIVELNKNLAEGAKISEEYGLLTGQLVEKERELAQAKGRVALAEKGLQAAVTAGTIQTAISIENAKAQWIEATFHRKRLDQAIADGVIQREGFYRVELAQDNDFHLKFIENRDLELAALNKLQAKFKEYAESSKNFLDVGTRAGFGVGEALPTAQYKPPTPARRGGGKTGPDQAKLDQEALNRLQEEANRLDLEDLRTQEATTLALKQKRDEQEALAKLQEDYQRVDAELGQGKSAEALEAARDARARAYQAYCDRLLQIQRETTAEQARLDEEAQKQAVAAQKKALEDLKTQLSQASEIQGKLSRGELGNRLDAFGAQGPAQAAAVQQYKLEVHWDAGAADGALAGLRDFAAQADDSFTLLREFSRSAADTVDHDLSAAVTRMVTTGARGAEQLRRAWQSASRSIIGDLVAMGIKKLEAAALDKAMAAATVASTATAEAAAKSYDAAMISTDSSREVAAEKSAAASFFSFFAPLGPFGVPAAIALIAMMTAAIGKIVAHGEGGVIDRPMLALLGERPGHTEIVANDTSFQAWAQNVSGASANLGFNLGAHQAQVASLHGQASSYAAEGLAQNGGMVPAHQVVDARGSLFLDSTEAKRTFDGLVLDSTVRIGRSTG